VTNSSNGPQLPVSDLRLKEDIRRIGSTVHDLPLYSFRYRGQEGAYEGVMAQDVLPVRPDAVVMGVDGFYRVDYDKLGIAMRRLDGNTPNLLDLAKNESGSNISKLSKSFGPNPPDDSDESDLRLKEDISRIGTTVHDLPLYTFRYRDREGTYEGVMAQDVLGVRPDAVSVGPEGFYRVNYGKLGIAMRRLDSPNLLDLAKNESGSAISSLTKTFGPSLPDDDVFSDLRLKEDISRIGTTVHDLPLYTFRYRDREGTYEGVMAQDVLGVRPDAVSVGPEGFYRVNYGKLGIVTRRLDSPNLLDLAKTESGKKISRLAKAYGPQFPDDAINNSGEG
jgi:hypothetical protein